MKKEVKSLANVTRKDVQEFFAIAAGAGIKPQFQQHELHEANRTLSEL